MQSRHRRKLLVTTAIIFVAAGLAWFLMPSPLSPTEQSLVGVWLEPARSGRHARFLIEFHNNRTCIQRPMDGSEMGTALYALGGTWCVEKEVLICRWGSRRETLVPVRAVSGGAKLGSVQLPTLKWLQPMKGELLRVAEDQLTIEWPGGDVDTWNRYPE
ncbi:MAG TPA: hypothetical protein VK395_11590 [Gemmataceae bacterium]|nr:hypothetical protein [Gemmataceae bacterium]